jgi:hypothetical protein
MDKNHWIKQWHAAFAPLRNAPGNNFVPVSTEVPNDTAAARALTHIQDRCELPARSIGFLMGTRMRAGCSFWLTCMCTRVPVSARDVLTGADGNVVEKAAGVAATHAFRGLSMCSTSLCPSTPSLSAAFAALCHMPQHHVRAARHSARRRRRSVATHPQLGMGKVVRGRTLPLADHPVLAVWSLVCTWC